MKKALLVGINYYNTSSQLNGCIDDIQNMRNMLIDAYHYGVSDIVMLRDDVSTPAMQPTRVNILAQMRSLIAESSGLEEIWIHYSGHGSQIKDTNRDEVSGLDSVLVPVDYNSQGFIVDDELFNLIKLIKCRAILLFDSCHSGSVCDLPWTFEYKFGDTFQRNMMYSSHLLSNPNIFMFSGCKDSQTSADIYDTVRKEYAGAFTSTFLECLRSLGPTVSMLALYRSVCISLSNKGYEQRPILSSTNVTPAYVLSKYVLPTKAKVSPLKLKSMQFH